MIEDGRVSFSALLRAGCAPWLLTPWNLVLESEGKPLFQVGSYSGLKPFGWLSDENPLCIQLPFL